jgi:adenosylcobinamide kinase / adenosylcobinamide-phosphate guanylyltransferase
MGLVFVTGGARSGKSAYALKRAEELPGPRVFIATATPFDDEMAKRIRRHRRDRNARRWKTVEAPEEIVPVLKKAVRRPVILLDCLSLWVNNLLYSSQLNGRGLDEPRMVRRMKEALAVLRESRGAVFVVSNEVNLGVVPDNPTARLYRDLLGRCNQLTAAAADEVVFMVSGIPMVLKSRTGIIPSPPAVGEARVRRIP